MANIKFNSVVLFVSDIDKSKQFYTEVLGLSVEQDFGTNVSLGGGLSMWQIAEDHTIIKKGLCNKINGHSKELYFETTNILESFAEINKTDLKFFHEIIEEPWGQKTFRFFDFDNHLLEIGETLETFVQRMSKEGMSIDEISDKTGIPANYVGELLEIE